MTDGVTECFFIRRYSRFIHYLHSSNPGSSDCSYWLWLLAFYSFDKSTISILLIRGTWMFLFHLSQACYCTLSWFRSPRTGTGNIKNIKGILIQCHCKMLCNARQTSSFAGSYFCRVNQFFFLAVPSLCCSSRQWKCEKKQVSREKRRWRTTRVVT